METPFLDQVFNRAFRTFGDNARETLIVSAVYCFLLFMALVVSLLTAVFLPDYYLPEAYHIIENMITGCLYFLIPLLMAVIFFCMTKAFTKMARGIKTRPKDYFPSLRAFLRYFIFLFALIISYIFATFFIPVMLMILRSATAPEGIHTFLMVLSGMPMFLAAVFGFAALSLFFMKHFFTFFSLAENTGLRDSVRKSIRITKGYFFKILLIFMILFFLNIAGFATIFGLIVTLPVSVLVLSHAYVELEQRDKRLAAKNRDENS